MLNHTEYKKLDIVFMIYYLREQVFWDRHIPEELNNYDLIISKLDEMDDLSINIIRNLYHDACM